jgi:large subunit ribosomal protein L9
MAKRFELLLRKSVENLGIVGDLVKVKPGYARNYLLPHRLAEPPTPSRIEALKEERAKALAELALLRRAREELVERMKEVEVTIVRSCNDQGHLYGSVTQRDIADALQTAGYDVGVRSVRLTQSIRRVGSYHVPLQFDRDLKADVTIVVSPDRELELVMEQQDATAQADTESAEPVEAESAEPVAAADEAPAKAKGVKKPKDKAKAKDA